MKVKVIILVVLFTVTCASGQTPQCPFTRGFNLAGWFQTESARNIPNWFKKTDFENIAALGCDHIRLPINLSAMCGTAPDYIIDPILFIYLDRTVDWAEELGLHIILDYHNIDPVDATNPATTNRLIAIWQQMAEHFKDRSTLVYYEILNEPRDIEDAEWGEMQRLAIEAIREIDKVHTIIVSPAGWGSYNHLSLLPEYDDDNLIYTFHFYDPFLFTHQGADWTGPSMEALSGIPYPYDAARMPELPASFLATWVEDLYSWYADDGTKTMNQSKMDVALDFRTERNVPIWCGEFGALQDATTQEDRLRWTQDIADIFTTGQVAWCCWGYGGGFGIFKEGTPGIFPEDLDIPIVEALGLTVPSFEPVTTVPDTGEIVLFDDLLTVDVNEISYGSMTLDYFYADNPREGDYCIYWANGSQYSNISWQFTPVRDFSTLVAEDYLFSFWLKANAPGLRFDVRFVDTDLQNGSDHPWRMSKTIDNTIAELDGSWHKVDIPLSEMVDSGSWHNNTWYAPAGLFDWTRIDKIEFVAEHQSLEGTEIFFDGIGIFSSSGPSTVFRDNMVPNQFELFDNYPNPFNPQTTIRFSLAAAGHAKISVYNTRGENVRDLVDTVLPKGMHQVVFTSGSDTPGTASGVYFYQMVVDGKVVTTKEMLFLK